MLYVYVVLFENDNFSVSHFDKQNRILGVIFRYWLCQPIPTMTVETLELKYDDSVRLGAFHFLFDIN